MSNIIDKTAVMKAFRSVIANAEVVSVIATAESIAVRIGEYDPLIHIQTLPETRIIDLTTQFAVIERPYDPDTTNTLFVREDFLPAMETSTANTVNMLSGIYRLSVFVPSTLGAISVLTTLNATTKYLQEIFSPEKDVITLTEAGSDGITIDACSLVSLPKEQEWLSAAVDVEFRVYRKETL